MKTLYHMIVTRVLETDNWTPLILNGVLYNKRNDALMACLQLAADGSFTDKENDPSRQYKVAQIVIDDDKPDAHGVGRSPAVKPVTVLPA